MLEFLSPVHWIDRNHDRVGPQNGKMRNHKLRTILHIEQHAIALTDSNSMQPGS